MESIKFFVGSDTDLENTEFNEGAIYFIFPNDNMTVGKIYVDIEGVRREISGAYNDLPVLRRLNELERIVIVPCTGISISEPSVVIPINDSVVFAAVLLPENTTDLPSWKISDDTYVTISSTSFDLDSKTATAILNGVMVGETNLILTAGPQTITIPCSVLDASYYEDVILEQNLQGDGSSYFLHQVPISLSNGQYIEAKIDMSQIDATKGVKQNLIGFGRDLSEYQLAPAIFMYTPQAATNNGKLVRMTFNSSSIPSRKFTGYEYNIGTAANGIMVIRLDSTGLYINDTKIVGGTTTQQQTIATVYQDLLNLNTIEVSNREGTVRSTAYYEYIKYHIYNDPNA